MNPRVTLLSDNPGDYCFTDTETRTVTNADPVGGDLKRAGAYKYARNARVVIVTYAIGSNPVQAWTATGDLETSLCWRDAPADLRAFLIRAQDGEAWFVAWQMAFDREVMNHGMVALNASVPTIPIRATLDAMAQGSCAALPATLAGAARSVGLTQKIDEGKALIVMFCTAGGATPDSHPAEWLRFVDYAKGDVDALRDIWRSTRQLPRAEWEVYWANETINAEGLPMDPALLEGAALAAEEYEAWAAKEVGRITGEDWGPKHHVALADWTYDRLSHLPEAVDIMAKTYVEDEDEDGVARVEVGKISLDRPRLEKLVPLLEAIDADTGLTDDEYAALQLCEVKTYAAGSTTKKFGKALDLLQADNRVRGQYVFNGAGQTGRFSSRGLQTHNLTRAWVGQETGDTGAEARAIEAVLGYHEEGETALAEFEAAFGPVGRTLSRLIRPAIIAQDEHTLLWGDYSNIEARVLPWLTADPRAEATLDIFRDGDVDPAAPDVYMIEAAKTYGKMPQDISKSERQIGKVQVLSLGFGGGWRALMAMAANYRLRLTQEQAEPLVRGWRANNPWATDFWADLWRAAMAAYHAPGTAHACGRLVLFFDAGHLGGTLYMMLPSERLLAYPGLRLRDVETVKPNGDVVVEQKMTFISGGMVKGLWYGILAENATQAAAADLLRAAIVRIVAVDPEFLIGHTHDELIAETRTEYLDEDKEWLREQMVLLPDWAAGLPVAADVEANEYYSKVEG